MISVMPSFYRFENSAIVIYFAASLMERDKVALDEFGLHRNKRSGLEHRRVPLGAWLGALGWVLSLAEALVLVHFEFHCTEKRTGVILKKRRDLLL